MTDADTHDEPEVARPVPPLMTATWRAATEDSDPLAALGAARALVALLSTWESQLAREAVAAGATWDSIGGTVGVSRQAAWERFHGEVDQFRSRVKSETRELRERHRKELEQFRQSVKTEARRLHRPVGKPPSGDR
jgi:hypothetical protein